MARRENKALGFNLNVVGLRLQEQPTRWQLTGKKLQAADQVG